VTVAAIIPWSLGGGTGSCLKFDGCTRLLSATVKKNALFFSEHDKKLTDLLLGRRDFLGVLFLVL